VREAEAALTTARVVRDYTEIRSLVDGIVTQRIISPGVLVSPGQAILKVAQISPIRLQANVAEADLSRIRVGARVTVRRQSDTAPTVTARVTSITPAMDPVARTGVVEALVPNTDRRFLPGQYVVMQISTEEPGTRPAGGGAFRVPASAIRWQSAPSSAVLATKQTPYVWVAEPVAGEGVPPVPASAHSVGASASEGHAYSVRPVEVRVGASDGRHTEVLSGLEAGQQVVARGHDNLHPGDNVAAVPWGSDGPQTLPAATPQRGGAPRHGEAHGPASRAGARSAGPVPGVPSAGGEHSGHGAGGP
jgi:RND family efflux transporter MFP subunit